MTKENAQVQPSLSETTKDQAQPDLANRDGSFELPADHPFVIAMSQPLSERTKAELRSIDLMIHAAHAAGDFRVGSASPQVQQSEGVPDGWKLVPIEPTEEMKDAAHQMKRGSFIEPGPKSYWDAMVNAAPTTQAVQT